MTETTLIMRDYPDHERETTLIMKDHPDERSPWWETIWCKTTLIWYHTSLFWNAFLHISLEMNPRGRTTPLSKQACIPSVWLLASYLKGRFLHHSLPWRLQHHGDAGQDGDDDHDPVQVGDQAQQFAADTQSQHEGQPLDMLAMVTIT